MERSFALQRGKIDLETGAFPLRLFTNTGDASDGHVIHIPGLQVDEITPMFVNHDPDPVRRMGSMSNPRKVGKKTQLGGGALTMDGRIDLEGEGPMAEIRRDIAHGISVGDITAMSGRWDPIKSVPRASLDTGHYAYSAIEGGWDTPMFFEKARVLEGSIVGVPADTDALIGRSRDRSKPDHVRKFYDVLVNGDPLSREKALACLLVDAAKIDGLEKVECESVGGKFFVPREMALAWGQSIDDEDAEEDRRHAGAYRKIRVGEMEREQISLTGDEKQDSEGMAVYNAAIARGDSLDQISELLESRHRESEFVFTISEWMDGDYDPAGEAGGFRERLEQLPPSTLRDEAIGALDRAMSGLFPDNEHYEHPEPEPVSVPDSKQERSEPVSVPTISETASAAVALLDLPEWPARDDVIQKGIAKRLKEWKATELGYIE